MLGQNVRVQASRSASPPSAGGSLRIRGSAVCARERFPSKRLQNLCFVVIIFHPRLLIVVVLVIPPSMSPYSSRPVFLH